MSSVTAKKHFLNAEYKCYQATDVRCLLRNLASHTYVGLIALPGVPNSSILPNYLLVFRISLLQQFKA